MRSGAKVEVLGVLAGLVAAAAGLYWLWPTALPPEQAASEFVTSPRPSPHPPAGGRRGDRDETLGVSPAGIAVDEEINLAVPFAPQAPTGSWEQPYQDACEEAAIIMVDRYLRGQGLTLAEMDTEILRMVDWQNTRYGFYKDSNIVETVRLAEQFYPSLTAEAVYNITAGDIRERLAAGRAVLVLVDGRRLGNPYYTGEGPDKHALVIKGFTGNDFITNDPGTRRGADFVYSEAVLMNALIDYDGGTPGTGKKAMIVVTTR
ncbi:MAG TPA: C39 family peptidase [Candidatus Andersenbacteria bacterium]|nr:C39 family peptidase [Candidatus Andersenbacteria bacterium]